MLLGRPRMKMELKFVLALAVVALVRAEEAAVKTATEATAEVKAAAARRQSLRVQIAAASTISCGPGTPSSCDVCCGPTNMCCIKPQTCERAPLGPPLWGEWTCKGIPDPGP